jgi:hypothetical protein
MGTHKTNNPINTRKPYHTNPEGAVGTRSVRASARPIDPKRRAALVRSGHWGQSLGSSLYHGVTK